jgi:hypothetical protein
MLGQELEDASDTDEARVLRLAVDRSHTEAR